MKTVLALIFACFNFSSFAYAECTTKSVMGGCVRDDVVNVAPHMRSDNSSLTTTRTIDTKVTNKAEKSQKAIATIGKQNKG